MISIVIPIYNDEKYIYDCLNSVKNQTYSDFECICLDDGSTDDTIRIIKQFIESDSRFVLYQNEHKGPGWQRNYGIKIATGEYITFMDHDDYVEKDWLKKLYDTLVLNDVDVSYCSNSDFYENTKKDVNYYFPSHLSGKVCFNESTIPEELLCSYFAPWRRLVKKSLLINNNVYFAEGHYRFDDVLFTQLLMENVKSVAFCDEVLYHHRIFDNSITGKSFENRDVYFEHFDSAKEVLNYAKQNGKDSKQMLIRMFPLFLHYLFYVNSKMKFFNQLKCLVYENNFPRKYKMKLFYLYLCLLKQKLKKIIFRGE